MLYTRYLNAAINESSCLSAAEMYTKRCFCHHGEFLTKVGPFAEEVHSSFRITCLASPAWEEQQKRFCAQKILKHWSKVSLSVFSCTVKFFQVSILAVQQRFLQKAVSFFFFFKYIFWWESWKHLEYNSHFKSFLRTCFNSGDNVLQANAIHEVGIWGVINLKMNTTLPFIFRQAA